MGSDLRSLLRPNLLHWRGGATRCGSRCMCAITMRSRATARPGISNAAVSKVITPTTAMRCGLRSSSRGPNAAHRNRIDFQSNRGTHPAVIVGRDQFVEAGVGWAPLVKHHLLGPGCAPIHNKHGIVMPANASGLLPRVLLALIVGSSAANAADRVS